METCQNTFHLAQVNIARMRTPLDDPIMADFVDQLAEVNALADESPGFVWRLADESGGGATDIRAFDDDCILVNMSVWESVEALRVQLSRPTRRAFARPWQAVRAPRVSTGTVVDRRRRDTQRRRREEKTGTTRGERPHGGRVHVQRAIPTPALA